MLAVFNKNSEFCTEAGVKYFILGSFSTGLLLLGLLMIYFCYGTLCFESIERISLYFPCLCSFVGYFFISIALLFKLGVFPFHMWLCDVYEGSIINITAFFSSIPKLILIGVFAKLSLIIFDNFDLLKVFVTFCGLCSICFASIATLYQKRIKRMLAYSTIGHSGFLILGICCSSLYAIKAFNIYAVLYILTTLTLFSILFIANLNTTQRKYLINWTSIFERNICIAISFALILCSLAGIPPLAGFYSKLCILFSLLSNNHVYITIVIACFSSIACFYYIRLVKILFFSHGLKSKFWTGMGSQNIEIFVSFGITIITLFLLRPNFLIGVSTITAITLF